MGCSPSKSKGREEYSTLRVDSSSNVPLVSNASVRPSARELLVVPPASGGSASGQRDSTAAAFRHDRPSPQQRQQQSQRNQRQQHYQLPAPEPSTPSHSIDPFQSIVVREHLSSTAVSPKSSSRTQATSTKSPVSSPKSSFVGPALVQESSPAYKQDIYVVPPSRRDSRYTTTKAVATSTAAAGLESLTPPKRNRPDTLSSQQPPTPKVPLATTGTRSSEAAVPSSSSTAAAVVPPPTSTAHASTTSAAVEQVAAASPHPKRNSKVAPPDTTITSTPKRHHKKKKKKRTSKTVKKHQHKEGHSTKEAGAAQAIKVEYFETPKESTTTGPTKPAPTANTSTAVAVSTKKTRRESKMSSASDDKPRLSQRAFSIFSIETPQPCSKSGKKFDELYTLEEVLGTGAFSTVRKGHHCSSKDISYAVKCVNRKKLSEEDEAALLDEVAILKEMKHIHIIRLYDFFVTPETYYLVMERMSGGELFDRIVAKAYYNEREARDVCKILIEAVGYCHSNQVAHRDLKPENLLLLGDNDSAVKIADFGFAKKVLDPNSLKTQCGTPGYVAPEILEGVLYDTKCDMWSVGVILYILLGGYPPFIENNQRELFRKIRKGAYEFHPEYWQNVSSEAKDLISSLLTVDPAKRLDAEQALENEWIRQDDGDLEKKDLGLNLAELKKFNAKRKFKAAVYGVMASNKLQSLGQDFQRNLS